MCWVDDLHFPKNQDRIRAKYCVNTLPRVTCCSCLYRMNPQFVCNIFKFLNCLCVWSVIVRHDEAGQRRTSTWLWSRTLDRTICKLWSLVLRTGPTSDVHIFNFDNSCRFLAPLSFVNLIFIFCFETSIFVSAIFYNIKLNWKIRTVC